MTAVALSLEQAELRDVVAKFLGQELPSVTERNAAERTEILADDVWQRCADLGFFGLGLPEAVSGSGLGPIEEALLFVEIGRHCVRGPFLSTVVAGWIATAAGDDALATELATGGRRVGLSTRGRLLDATAADLVVHLGDACELRPVSDVAPQPCVDRPTDLATGRVGPAIAAVDDPAWRSRIALLVASMQVGMAEATRDMAVEYAKGRHQFGRPIGTFQAVKHRCSDMAIRAAAGYAQVVYAAFELDRRSDHAAFHTASAAIVARDAARRNAADNIQNHGAIAFTDEHPAAGYARRAQVLEALLGDVVTAEAVLAVPRVPFETVGPAAVGWFAATAPSDG